MSNYMEAFEIATEAIERERRTRKNRASTHLAGAALEALMKAGFTLDLPAARPDLFRSGGQTYETYPKQCICPPSTAAGLATVCPVHDESHD